MFAELMPLLRKRWIGDHFFSEAKNEGWFDAILAQTSSHPRAIRTREYADHCDEPLECIAAGTVSHF